MSHVDEGMLHGYLDGELSPAEVRGMDAHLAQCPECRRRLEDERALIARAAELLALAAPPDRELPPFRAGDVKPPTRLWWHVRLPLAWAATIVLALGVGTYLGRGVEQVPPTETASDARPTPRHALDARAGAELAQTAEKETSARVRSAARTPPAARPAAPAAARALADSIAPRPSESVALRADTLAAPVAYAERARDSGERRMQAKTSQEEPDPWQKGKVISVDSARRVLGADPLVVPGVPIEAVYQGRRIGYSHVVIVEQTLDSTTMIEVVNARTAPQLLSEVVVAGAPTPRAAPAPAADSLARAESGRRAAKAAGQARPDLFRDIRGPLSPDSLAALLRRLQPLRAATGP